MWSWSDHMGGWWWVTVPMMLAFWALVAWVVIVLVRSSNDRRSGPDAEEIRAERLARGDIDEAEYRRRRELVRGD